MMLFLLSMLGQTLAHRTLAVIARDFAFSQRLLRPLLVLNLIIIIALATFFHSSPVTHWLLIGILLISLNYFPLILRFFMLKRLSSALIPLLDCVILGLQSGKSFRVSMNVAIENQHGWMRKQMRDLYNSIVTSDQHVTLKSALLKDLQQELMEIDRSQNRCLDQVRALRRQLKTQENFRRRSGQVTQQIKMQAIIVTALYLGLLFFVIVQFGFIPHRFLIFFSSSLFFLGLFWIFNMGRRIKWKV